MIQWKERLYAFLMRRFVGPWLDEESGRRLYQSINVSLQDGVFVLRDVSLATHKLAAHLRKPVRIRKATIDKLEIHLQLQENDDPTTHHQDDHAEATAPTSTRTTTTSSSSSPTTTSPTTTTISSTSSLAWRAWKLTSGQHPGAVSVLVQVMVEGIRIDIEPSSEIILDESPSTSSSCDSSQPHVEGPTAATPNHQSSKGMFTAYMEAVLASIRLALQISDLEIRFLADPEAHEWCSLRVQSFSYQDERNQPPSPPPAADAATADPATSADNTSTPAIRPAPSKRRNYETIMQKVIDMHRVSIVVGTDRENNGNTTTTMVALLEGNSRLKLWVIAYRPEKSDIPSEQAPNSNNKNNNNNAIQHDIEITLGHKLNLLVDEFAVRGLIHTVQNYACALANPVTATATTANATTAAVETTTGATSSDHVSLVPSTKQAEEDMEILDGILRQYSEARRWAERHEVRGGILVPAEDNLTYDAFFDANDQSIYRYSTVLSQTLLSNDGQGQLDFVRFKARLFLNSGSFKMAFGTMITPNNNNINSAKVEYILASFSDLNVNLSLSTQSSLISFSLLHFEVEESRQVILPVDHTKGTRTRTEISRVLHFISSVDSSDSDNMDSDRGELLLTSPCLSVEIQSGTKPETVQLSVNLEPIQLSCHPTTISNMVSFGQGVSLLWQESPRESERHSHDVQQEFHFNLSCPSVDILYPLIRPSCNNKLDTLFDRCGYVGDGTLSPASVSLGTHTDSLYLTFEQGTHKKSASLTCKHAFLYIASPSKKRGRMGQCQMVDLLCLSGTSHPMSIDMHFSHNSLAHDADQPNHAVQCFPLAPTIASFKARQQDEDEENQIDRILLSKMGDMGISARRELRGKDPQRDLLENCQKCQISIHIHIPLVMCDVTIDESLTFLEALSHGSERTIASNTAGKNTCKTCDGTTSSDMAICIELDHVSCGLHSGVASVSCSSSSTNNHSFILKMRRVRAHSVIGGPNGTKHVRFLTQEIDFFEAESLVTTQMGPKSPSSSEERSMAVFQRLKLIVDASANPIFYRSHLFKPLSRESPSILVDILFQEDGSSRDSRRSVYCTLYDITYRHVDESLWMDRARAMLSRFSSGKENGQDANKVEAVTTLTRIFLAVADCNVDYATPLRFQNKARIVLRLGDLRCSSNIVLPAPAIQAFNLSLADFSLCLCNNRHPYAFENSCLLDSDMLFADRDRHHTFVDANAAVKHMNLRTMLILDTVDAIIAVASDTQVKKRIPKIYTSLTLGELSLFGSKDSFWLLIQAVGEAAGELTAVSGEQITAIKEQERLEDEEGEDFFDSIADEEGKDAPIKQPAYFNALDDLRKKSALRPAVGTKSSQSQKSQFLLDGYDWTTIDQAEPTSKRIADDQEQFARWYTADAHEEEGISGFEKFSDAQMHPVRIFTHHFPLRPDNDPLADGDMGASKYAGTVRSPAVANRLLIHDMKLKIRLFDGYDWPELLSTAALNRVRTDSFLIDCPAPAKTDVDSLTEETKDPETEKTSKLMADLLSSSKEDSETFKDTPLPEEKGARLTQMAQWRRLSRRTGKYLQISASGICLRNDSMQQPSNHKLVSCLNFKVQDFFVAETISVNKPIKMVGEWFSEDDHPRDSRDGLLMMKMITWAPSKKITDADEIANDECEAVVKMLPLRCLLDQKAIRFATTFFRPDDAKECTLPKGLHAVPPPKVRVFRFKPFRLKVDYKPEKMDRQALRDGQIVELINLSPLHGMVLTLQQVEVRDSIGFGDVVSALVKSWIADICSTQIIKFLTNARPFEPLTTISGGAVDLVVLPWEAFQNGDSIQRSMRSGAKSFAKAVTYEALTISSGVAEFMASQVASVAGHGTRPILPCRPENTPRGVTDAAPHALESLARGFQEANFKVVIVPYREYQRHGTSGALKSVLKGIPVAIAAPASGAAEALSFALLGARNQFRPDIRKEEEVNQRGLRLDA